MKDMQEKHCNDVNRDGPHQKDGQVTTASILLPLYLESTNCWVILKKLYGTTTEIQIEINSFMKCLIANYMMILSGISK